MDDRRDDEPELRTTDPDRLPEANAPEFEGDHWDADATDVGGAIDEQGETARSELPPRPEGGEVPTSNEDRLDDRA